MSEPLLVSIRIDTASWRQIPKVETLIMNTAIAAWRAAAPANAATGKVAEISVLLADDAIVRRLNADWRGQDRPTNVLSFALEADALDADAPGDATRDAPQLIGDIALAFETVAGEAERDGKTLEAHLAHLVVHGVLHLLGHDHEEDAAATSMETLETAVLARLSIPDPYVPAPALAAGRSKVAGQCGAARQRKAGGQ